MIHATATQGIPTLVQQVQALGVASAMRLREAAAVSRSPAAAMQRAALHRRHILSQLAHGGALAINSLRESLAVSKQAGINPHISRSGVCHLVESMRQSGWLSCEMAADRFGIPSGSSRIARYRITALGLAALAAMREDVPTPPTTGDH
ncbi:MAG: hypothetical protein RBT67_07530 [Thauera sp.]|jgi:hypothetical protein|nr:hypothetical protein [Thauera sp.]